MAHSGPSASGSFVQTLTLTDVATGWTECAPLLFREQRLLSEVLRVVYVPVVRVVVKGLAFSFFVLLRVALALKRKLSFPVSRMWQ